MGLAARIRSWLGSDDERPEQPKPQPTAREQLDQRIRDGVEASKSYARRTRMLKAVDELGLFESSDQWPVPPAVQG